MVDERPVTGPDGLDGGVVAGGLAGPDEIRDGAGRREDKLLHCRACGRVLPDGQRKYCLDGAGLFDEQNGVACRVVGPHLEFFREHGLLGTAAAAAADLTVLGTQVTAVLDVLSATGPIETLRGTLSGIAGQLQDTVTEALGERDRALEAERTALGKAAAETRLREIGDRQVTEALAARQRLERERNQAVDRQHDAEDAQRKAGTAQARAEGERDTQRDRAERAEQRLTDLDGRVRELETANAGLTSQVSTLTEQLRKATERADRERDRADKVREQTEQQLDRIRTETEQAVTAARTAVTEQAERHAGVLQQLERDRAGELRDRDQDVLAARTALTQLRRDISGGLTRLRDAVLANDPGRIRQGMRDLADVLGAAPDPAEGGHDDS